MMLELQPKARIEGDVQYAALEMHQGAIDRRSVAPYRGRAKKSPH